MSPNDPVGLVRSALPGAVWPGIPNLQGTIVLALQFQLELSQWYPAPQLRALQSSQLDLLLRHAHASVPYYRERWEGLYDASQAPTPDRFGRLPILTRAELQAHFERLKSTEAPSHHGPVVEVRTSGSTGQPVRLLKSGLADLMWETILLREHHWFGRDLTGKLAAIRQGVKEQEADGWGTGSGDAVSTGRLVTLPIRTDVDAQLLWLARQQPAYLLTYPSNLKELVVTSLEHGTRVPGLREVRTFGELLDPEIRTLCRDAWGVPVVDCYSTVEAGYIALQCPREEHYHVQAESVLVEVLDEHGRACAPGETGRVVVTTLHNFAMPLVRYDIGDYAEVGGPCPCGRGLPVLRRIMGRSRNMLVTADGRRFWPALGTRAVARIAPVLQYQLVQTTVDLIEVRLVTAAPLTQAQEEGLRQLFMERLPAGLQVRLVPCDSISRGAGGKFEDFVSEVAPMRR